MWVTFLPSSMHFFLRIVLKLGTGISHMTSPAAMKVGRNVNSCSNWSLCNEGWMEKLNTAITSYYHPCVFAAVLMLPQQSDSFNVDCMVSQAYNSYYLDFCKVCLLLL